jgi:rare lipoprotein A
MREPSLAALVACTLVLAACGPKHPYAGRSQSPPPPVISSDSPQESVEDKGSTLPEERPEDKEPISARKPKKSIYVEEGLASWYGPPYHNRRSSNGEIYDMHAMTAAHRTLPLNSLVLVINVATGKSAVVRITDRGPFIRGRMLDLSLAAAKAVDVWRPGVARVRIEVLETPAPIDRGGRWCVQIGAFDDVAEASHLKEKLEARYRSVRVLQFTGPTGEWLRVRVSDDDKHRAESLAAETHVENGGVFLVRLD